MSTSIISVSNLDFSYESNYLVLESLNFEIFNGEYVAIIGENGSGKSTLIRLLIGLLKPTKGVIKLFGQDIQNFQSWFKIGYLPQFGSIDIGHINISCEELINSAKAKKQNSFQTEPFENIIELLDIKKLLKKSFNSLSGGQKQKILIARSLINYPELLILDEPTSGVDKQSRTDLYVFLKFLNQSNKITILHITHDFEKISEFTNRLFCIKKHQLLQKSNFNSELTKIRNVKKKIQHVHS